MPRISQREYGSFKRKQREEAAWAAELHRREMDKYHEEVTIPWSGYIRGPCNYFVIAERLKRSKVRAVQEVGRGYRSGGGMSIHHAALLAGLMMLEV